MHVRRDHDEDAAAARDRIGEIAEILALGLVRLRARQSSRTPANCGESSLEPVAHQSGHANPETENAA